MTDMELVRHRRSVRTFDGNPLREEDAKKILACAEEADNPFELPITWRILDLKENKLSFAGCQHKDLHRGKNAARSFRRRSFRIFF